MHSHLYRCRHGILSLRQGSSVLIAGKLAKVSASCLSTIILHADADGLKVIERKAYVIPKVLAIHVQTSVGHTSQDVCLVSVIG